MRHGYTNETVRDGDVVVKTYAGPDAVSRAAREYEALTAVRGRVPVPPVLGHTATALTLAFVAGVHGQDLMDHAEPVLRACGNVLRDIHALGIAHGDFGPNNVLLDPDTFTATAVLDWEFATIPLADPAADLAWCEWIVRAHHPGRVGALGAFFAAYGSEPSWQRRHAAMLRRCAELADFARRWEPGGAGERLWRERTAMTAAWTEVV